MKRSVVYSAALILGCSALAFPAPQGRGKGGGGRGLHGPPSRPQTQGRHEPQPHGQGSGKQAHGAQHGEHSTGRARGSAAEFLERHPEQASRLQQLLPPGADVNQAAGDFKNFGQFVAAAHVSNNLNIPFDDLKEKLTGPEATSLGKAIRELRPDLTSTEVRQAVKAANREAKQARKAARKQKLDDGAKPEP
jgi:hypothetical protein